MDKNNKKYKEIYADTVIIKAGKVIIHEDENHSVSYSSSSYKHESSSSSSSSSYYDPWE
ncbi:hypothetical protein [Fictibacillus phosphorivorans]|uniref:hypothetical protein n=1 Tax=Fictibacillus phosphorivorans TaxID=1221500 RepID=UPI00203F7846|nr:hypothetical protein [Fictibacillus phosphorivorans]MCM3719155.1 hypothetical protein [Fictibacillus phosphorivorans]MCM3776777.1 hypothetical protein [Fictibacillus phosphorivorans]